MPFVRTGDVTIHFEVTGSGPPLLLLPGLGVAAGEMRPLVEPLAEDHTVVVIDNRGAGLSDKPDEPYSIELMAADAVAVLDAAGIAQASVLGYSMGGRIALHLAIAQPARVDRLVLLATGARTIPTRSRRVLFAISPYLPVGAKPRQPVFAFKRQRAASQGYDARGRLVEVRAPTLILHGRRDRIAPPVLAEELHAGIAASQLQWYEGGHVTPMFKPVPVVEAVRTFLS